MKSLVWTGMLMAMIVIALGAYTRLTDAGLGCPDWPGCYGHYSVPSSDEHLAFAEKAFPQRPVEPHKAWNEMIHRYFAGGLGLVILLICGLCLLKAEQPKKLPVFLLLLVLFQAMLGMWTVTMELLPLVVMGHLLGGFAVLCCLFLLLLRQIPYRIPGGDAPMRQFGKFWLVGIGILLLQICLGAWTSANYAALACTQFPLCESDWSQRLDFAGAFSVPESQSYEFGAHNYAQRVTIHITHRLGAVLTFVYLSWLCLQVYWRTKARLLRSLASVVMLLLGFQVLLGVSNVAFKLPLLIALAHNITAATLLLACVALTYTLYRKT